MNNQLNIIKFLNTCVIILRNCFINLSCAETSDPCMPRNPGKERRIKRRKDWWKEEIGSVRLVVWISCCKTALLEQEIAAEEKLILI